MVKIKEVQYDRYHPEQIQERVIKYSSWDDYHDDITTKDGTVDKLKYPSLPPKTEPYNIHIWKNTITVYYRIEDTVKEIVHVATLLEDCEDNNN